MYFEKVKHITQFLNGKVDFNLGFLARQVKITSRLILV